MLPRARMCIRCKRSSACLDTAAGYEAQNDVLAQSVPGSPHPEPGAVPRHSSRQPSAAILRTPVMRLPVLMRFPALQVTVAALLILWLPPFALRSRILPVPAFRFLIPPIVRPGLLLRTLLIPLAHLLLRLRLFRTLRRLRPRLLRFLRSIRRPLARMLILRHGNQRRTQHQREKDPVHYRKSLHSCPRINFGSKPDATRK